MTRSYGEEFNFFAIVIVLYIGVVVSMNCDSSRHGAVPFCSEKSASGRAVYLSGIDIGTNGIGCNCSFSFSSTSPNQDPVEIEIKNVTTASHLCDYSLHFVYKNNNTRQYSCDSNLINGANFNMGPAETVRLHMEPGTYNNAAFSFCLELYIVQVNYAIKLQCTSKSTNTVSTTSLAYMNTTSTNNFMSTISNNNKLPISTWENHGTVVSYSTSNTNSVIHSTTKPQTNNSNANRLIGIIVGSILAVLAVVALVIVIVCVVKRRKKRPSYETPLEPQERSHSNINEAITSNSNAKGCKYQITNPDRNQGMIYLENDLYKSIDDDEPVGRRGGNHEGMIYLENDLYISSNVTDDVNQDAENSVPHQPVEYAVVNKTAKKNSSGNGASMGHTVGPHGDEYTLVLKK